MAKEILYCAAILKFIRNQWKADFEYFHASDLYEANIKYRAGNSNDIISGKMRITGIAPVVGYQQDDKTGVIYA